MSRSHSLDYALELARFELPVFPCKPNSKRPAIRGWQSLATTDGRRLLELWKPRPDANPAVATRGLVVVDTDSEEGERWVQERELPRTATVRTARGLHRYYRGQIRSGVLAPGVDLKGNINGRAGGLALGPGSVVGGHEYRWELHPAEVGVTQAPALLSELKPKPTIGTAGPIFEGQRHTALCSLAGRLFNGGLRTEDELFAALTAANLARCRPPLREDEVRKLAHGAAATFSAPPWLSTEPLELAEFCADPELSAAAIAALHAVSVHANYRGSCHPGLDRLARLTGLDARTVSRAIKELEAKGRIEVERESGKSHRYTLLPWPSRKGVVVPPTKLRGVGR